MKKTIFAILITLLILTACSKQQPINQDIKTDISDQLDKITENIEDLDFNENISKVSQELETDTQLEKISVPATITKSINKELIQNELEKKYNIVTKAGNTIKLILPNKDPNGIEITYTFQYPFDKDGIFKATKGNYKTKIIATAQNIKVEKEFTVLVN